MNPLVVCEDVSRTYAGIVPVHALRGVSFTANRGELLAIVGPSGSGKSTLLGLLGCLDAPTSGRLAIAGHETTALTQQHRARLRRDTIGFVFQQFHLIPHLSARENVETALLYRGLGREERRARANAALERVGLATRASHRPAHLSGGEQQRVAIARALVANPSLLLADEPTGNLDTGTSDMVVGLLQEIVAEGLAVVLITHDLRIAAHASRRLELLDGRIVADSGHTACTR